MRVAVTGGAGRLGRSVVEGLRAAGHHVTSIDRSTTGVGDEITADLTDPAQTAEILESLSPDALVHLAAIAVPFSAPERTIFEVNTGMGFTVLEAAVNAGITNILVASSPTVLGYGRSGWHPGRLPLDEGITPQPFHAYALSKVVLEKMVASFALANPGVRLASFRPCYVIAPEEWEGAPTQQGHTVEERLAKPELAAVSLFNYLDARDAAGFVDTWLGAEGSPSGACYFVSAADAMSVAPPAELLAQYLPEIADLAGGLTGHESLFSIDAARRDLGWEPTRSWRNQLAPEALERLGVNPAALQA
ncbi:NAD-dependent epimerase/dehydratase family protein [Nesterenkonia flava]|uniref:NAD(P)-dependent oxidoreductase n=1 Tax=Nesterenkonia flava TaxID=469799 RepID=A0ABU1FUB7_9MICC|nr:NAD(P)-dependent oxidoreductase [Nesterenkonia flava]MDR5711746.1 NAD(P)-dependent oxidoreductase [Nesterenkonia flava]